MADEYVPTTEEVREMFRKGYLHPDDLDFDDVPGSIFDRWLAQHDAAQQSIGAEQALREAAQMVEDTARQGGGWETAQRTILREADRLAAERDGVK